MHKQHERILDDNYAAWCEHDSEKIARFFTDDCVYEDMAMDAVFHGKQQLIEFTRDVFITMPDFHVSYTKRFADDTFGAGQWVIKATWNGDFEGVDCTGKKIEFTGLSFYRFSQGRIARAQDCWDYSVMMEAFGVVRDSLRVK